MGILNHPKLVLDQIISLIIDLHQTTIIHNDL